MMLSRAKSLLIAGGLLALSSTVLAGVDKVYEKPAGQKTWGQLLSDALGVGNYKKSYALVVGISNYTGGYKSLPTEKDAERMRKYLLDEAGFDYVHVVTDDKVSAARINTIMLDELRPRIDENDRFLFYWSGHGIDEPTGDGKGMVGFLPMADSEKGALGSMINMGDIARWDNLIRAEQALFLLDACFSGLAAVTTKSDPRALSVSQLAKPSHHIISAGTGEEEAIAGSRWGGSLFTLAVLDGLRGAADSQSAYPQDGVVSLNELIGYLKIRIAHETQRANWEETLTPQLGNLKTSEGEFFFITNAKKTTTARNRGGSPTGKFVHGEPVVTKGGVIGGGINHRQSGARELKADLSDNANFEPLEIYSPDSRLRRLSRPVGRLDVQFSSGKWATCTATLIANDRILTSYHCVPSTGKFGDVVAAALVMGFYSNTDEASTKRYKVDVRPLGSSEALAYAILRVGGDPGRQWGTATLSSADPEPGAALLIIHHPEGKRKHVTRGGCRAGPILPQTAELPHKCDTLPGSTGAPIISDDSGAVVALHYAGGASLGPGSYNYGKLVSWITNTDAFFRGSPK